MFHFLDKLALNKGLMLLLCSITLALLCVELCLSVKRGRVYARKVVTTACQAILIVAVVAAIGFLLSMLPLAVIWQQVLKKIPLTIAYGCKGIIIVYGMLWGALFFSEKIPR